ncbi:MAG: hypothetical protein ACMG6E_05560 [Candidatus Roizmanbacteria bacterium]
MGGNQTKLDIPNQGLANVSVLDLCQRGRVIKILDNNTIFIVSKYPVDSSDAFFVYRFRCQIIGLDTPRLNSPRKSETNIAQLAMNYLADTLLGKVVILKEPIFMGDSISAIVMLGDLNIRDQLLAKRLALPAYDLTRKFEVDWQTHHDTSLLIRHHSVKEGNK